MSIKIDSDLHSVKTRKRLDFSGFNFLSKQFSSICFLMFIFLTSCDQFPEMSYLFVETKEPIQINDSIANFTAFVENFSGDSIVESGFYWGMIPNEKELKIVNTGSHTGLFSLQTDKLLLPGRTVFLRAFVKTDDFELLGKELQMVTRGDPNLGKWVPLQSYPSDQGYCGQIKFGFASNDGFCFVLNDGQIIFYDFASKKETTQFKANVLREADLGFKVGEKVFVFSLDRFHELDINDFSLKSLRPWPSVPRKKVVGFAIGNDLYVGMGNPTETTNEDLNSFWKYQTLTDTWTPITRFPGKYRIFPVGYSLVEKGGIAGGIGNQIPNQPGTFGFFPDFWQFNPVSNSWTEIRNVPTLDRDKGVFSYSGVSVDGQIYFFVNNSLFRYNSDYRYWEDLATNFGTCFPFLFGFKGELFFADVKVDGSKYQLTLFRYEK